MRGSTIQLSNLQRVVERVRPYYLPRAEIRIYACLFASAYERPNSFTANARSGSEESVRYGAGIKAMQKLARAAGIPVLAGFRSQEGLSGEFLGPYARVNSSGAWSVHQGRKVPMIKEASYVVRGIVEDTAAKVKKAIKDTEKDRDDFVTRLGRMLEHRNARFL